MEIRAEARTLSLVPNLSLSNIKFGSAAYLYVRFQGRKRSSRRFTSSQEL
jgi:hypothetical protein